MDLEVAWSGTMEHDGTAPGLSSYKGRSSIFHSANWERTEALEYHMNGPRLPGSTPRGRGHDRKPRAPKCDPVREAKALEMLERGVSYGAISRALDVSTSVPRRLARRLGIDRSKWKQAAA